MIEEHKKLCVVVNMLSFMESLCGAQGIFKCTSNRERKHIFQWEHILATVFICLMIHDVLVFVRPF